MAAQNKPGLIFLATYLLTWISGIIVYLIAGGDKRKKFHAIQAILLGIVIFIINALIGWVFGLVGVGSGLIAVILWLYGMYVGYKAYQGQDIEMPVIGVFAQKYKK